MRQNDNLIIKVKRLENCPKDLPLPGIQTTGAAGHDVCANLDGEFVLNPGERTAVPTGIAISVPFGYEVQVRPRSGLCLKHGIILPNSPGTIDSDYRGELKVLMMNLGDGPFIIRRGDRIAQLVVGRVVPVSWLEVDELDETQRSDGGFGHTGV
jgi:dUTP diphosphatase